MADDWTIRVRDCWQSDDNPTGSRLEKGEWSLWQVGYGWVLKAEGQSPSSDLLPHGTWGLESPVYLYR